MPRYGSILLWLGMLAGVLLAGCVSVPSLQHASMLRGFNALQDDTIAWNSPEAHRSIKRMAAMGANAVVFISFLKQASVSAVKVETSDAVTEQQLKSAINYAHRIGLKVILKPQMLVPGSWAGGIRHANSKRWHAWFESYSRQIINQAMFAAAQHVDAFVIGTELFHAAGQVNWSVLIRAVRSVYHGKITYAAHNVAGVRSFRHWKELDAVALTLYPSLGASGTKQDMQQHMDHAVQALKQTVAGMDRPLWVMEVGMPSARGASEKPWVWQGLNGASVDLAVQKNALDLWIKTLDQDWVDGVFIWAWYSDLDAGGRHNPDYTPQNKPAEHIIRHYWK